ncbi:hypothetical protein, partial [Escherichia coli]|uniref:hypothetical protein n=1 Tax=Escherichia coli TaxID=562 RepID=UPI001FFF90AB|nr:hypothetical protein [Escherichia coli]
KACVLPENPASYRVVRTKSYLFNKAIAKLAVTKGFDSLSAPQKRVLQPFLSHPCGGVRNPGGHHNGCSKVISGYELEEAYNLQGYYGDLLCQNCREESDGYEIERERFMQD